MNETPKTVQRKLLRWFDQNQRDLPWRKNKTPYRIWISEIMLQQTQVVTVIDYYKRFLKAFPNVKRLAKADEQDVLKLWEGLGYYRRARQMHKAAKIVVEQHAGVFPTDFDSVLALPGIGRYTAGAVLSISLDQKLPILEGNTIRLFARLMLLRENPRTTENQKRLWRYSESLLPSRRCGDFNQALMELGSEICKPKNPACDSCPLSNGCPTYVQGLTATIPAAGNKIQYEAINEAVVILKRRRKYLVRLCGEGERWAGLWDFPRYKISGPNKMEIIHSLDQQLHESTGLSAELEETDITINHAVTRYRIRLDCFYARNIQGRARPKMGNQLKWVTLGELAELPLSVTGRKITKKLGKITTTG